MAGTNGTDNDNSTFRLLCDEYALFLRLTRSSKKFANKLVQRFLEEGERDRDGRIRYKLWLREVWPGGVVPPSPYDGDFWRSDPGRDINCTIEPWNGFARWTAPASAEWREFDGREVADHQVFGIRLNHDDVLDFLESIGLLSKQAQSGEPSTAEGAPEESLSKSAPVKSAPLSEKNITLKSWVPRALVDHPPPRGEKDIAGHLMNFAPKPWKKHSIQNVLSGLAPEEKPKPKKS